MAGEGELLLRETYSLERDLLPRPRTEDEVTPGEPIAKPKTEKKAAIAAPVSRVLRRDLQLGDRLVDERGEWRVSDEDASPGWAARLRRLAAHELLGAASASGWAPAFHGESRDDLRPVFLPVACHDKHALRDDAGLEHGSNWRDQLRAVTQGYRPPGRIDILDST